MIGYMQALEQIAIHDPRLAVALLRSNVSQPQVYNLRVTFSDGTPDKPVSAQMEPITEDFWVYGLIYTVNQPNLWKGNLFRGLAQVTNTLQPGINGQLSVQGGVGLPWLVNVNPIPLETLLRSAPSGGSGPSYGCNTSFLMFFPQSLKGTFWLTREYIDSAGVGEIPAIVDLALTGLTLGVKQYGSLTVQQSRQILREEFRGGSPDIIAEQMADRLAKRFGSHERAAAALGGVGADEGK